MGGFLAASTTDLIQSIVMTIALVVVVAYGTHIAGGTDAVIENARSLPGYLSLINTHNVETGNAQNYGFLTTISTLAWGLGYFGMPHILLRFMAIENEEKLVLSRRSASVWVVISMSVSVLIGIVGLAITKTGAIPFLSGSDSETIIIKIEVYRRLGTLLLSTIFTLILLKYELLVIEIILLILSIIEIYINKKLCDKIAKK